MGIKQINISYLLHEDRVLLKINTDIGEGFAFLLTRRVALFLCAAINHLVSKVSNQENQSTALHTFSSGMDKQGATQSDVKDETFEEGKIFPLGEAPMLVLEVNCSAAQDNQQQLIAIALTFGNQQNINIQLPIPMVSSIQKLLEKVADQAGWGRAVITEQLATTVQNFTMDAPSGSSTIH